MLCCDKSFIEIYFYLLMSAHLAGRVAVDPSVHTSKALEQVTTPKRKPQERSVPILATHKELLVKYIAEDVNIHRESDVKY